MSVEKNLHSVVSDLQHKQDQDTRKQEPHTHDDGVDLSENELLRCTLIHTLAALVVLRVTRVFVWSFLMYRMILFTASTVLVVKSPIR